MMRSDVSAGAFRCGSSMALAGMLVLSSGCAGLDKVVEGVRDGIENAGRTKGYPQISNTVAQSCATGAALGYAYERIDGDQRSDNRSDARRLVEYGQSIAIGTVIGCTVGLALDKRRSGFDSDAEFYDREIELTRSANAELVSVSEHLDARAQVNREQLAVLERQRSEATLSDEQAREARDVASADVVWARRQLGTAKENLEAQQTVLNTSAGKIDGTRDRALKSEVDALEREVDNLERRVVALSEVNDSIGEFSG